MTSHDEPPSVGTPLHGTVRKACAQCRTEQPLQAPMFPAIPQGTGWLCVSCYEARAMRRMSPTPGTVATRIAALENRRTVLLAMLDECRRAEDWHGVCDAAVDVRETDAAIVALRWASDAR